MADLIYDSKRIVPAPLVNITKNYIKTGDGTGVGALYDIVITGTLLPFRGSPSGSFTDISNSFWTQSGDPPDEVFAGTEVAFEHLIKKQEALRFLFRQEGKTLEIFPSCSGTCAVKCNPRVISIQFPQGQWVDRAEYTITLEADWIFINNFTSDKEDNFEVELIKSGQEQWSFDEIQGQIGNVYTVSHTVSSQGILGYDETGSPFVGPGEIAGGESWKHAKKWCENRIVGTISPDIMFAIIGTSGFIGGSYVKNTNLTSFAGDYSVTETWTLSQNNYFIEKSFSLNRGLDGLVDVSYQGKITGLSEGERAGGPQSIINAKTAIPTNSQAKLDAENMLGVLLETFQLSTSPSQKNISINNPDATVNFSFNWSADEDSELFRKTCEANLGFDIANGSYSLSLNCDIQGKGDTIDEKITNAKLAIPSESGARQQALDLLGDQLPSGITIASDFSSKSISINDTQGSIKFGYVWKNTTTGFDNFEVSVDIQFPNEVVAIIPIPGRVAGPIIQDMDTITQQIVTVSLNSFGNDVKPSNASVISIIEDAADFVATWILQSDKETFSPTSGKYTRTRSYLVD